MKLSYHCEYYRAERVQKIIDTVGLGQIVAKKYFHSMNDILNGKPGTYTCITDTGVTMICSEDMETIITVYITTYKELINVYNGEKKIPPYLKKKVNQNQAYFIRNGKTFLRQAEISAFPKIDV